MALAKQLSRRVTAPAASDVFLVKGGYDRSGLKAWYFVRVQSAKMRAFHAAAKQGTLNIPQFGQILTSGFGDAPPDSIVQNMRLHYGYKGTSA